MTVTYRAPGRLADTLGWLRGQMYNPMWWRQDPIRRGRDSEWLAFTEKACRRPPPTPPTPPSLPSLSPLPSLILTTPHYPHYPHYLRHPHQDHYNSHQMYYNSHQIY
jgi:hypothetical protein